MLEQAIEKGADSGLTVCSCFGVGSNTICNAIAAKGLQTVKEVTACVKAGGNCGSCVPEIKKLLVEMQAQMQMRTQDDTSGAHNELVTG